MGGLLGGGGGGAKGMLALPLKILGGGCPPAPPPPLPTPMYLIAESVRNVHIVTLVWRFSFLNNKITGRVSHL